MTNKVDKCDYSKGLIYKLRCLDPEIKDIYVGSTLNEVARRKKHKSDCHNTKSKAYNLCVYQFIRSHGGWENWKLVPIKLYPCNSKLELRMEEERMIEELEEFSTLNRHRAYLDEEIKKEETKEYLKKYHKKYYEENKEEILEKTKKYFEENKEKMLEKQKEYYNNNKKEKRMVIVECECGVKLQKISLTRHKKGKNKQHLAWLQSQK